MVFHIVKTFSSCLSQKKRSSELIIVMQEFVNKALFDYTIA